MKKFHFRLHRLEKFSFPYVTDNWITILVKKILHLRFFMFLDQNFARIPNLLSEKYFSDNFLNIRIHIFTFWYVNI